ncbi:hypothetical protein H112_06038 [Trichophyton rubrum D6]|uniref:Uncharacterized protein n=2 Tax=Trichophyton TaxID=5550 RepID=A0A022VWV2_TRIRU|nr:hypothetical protein H100_06052 [Trichophyton rubrum MR850]EZF39853.1 hypothetical protein H102_06021 [Trichophyton rubrum CBS 100081]EZF50536.1 hypothetical protein H103_06045 [Trichophyton rubrum CBS 288.86]EZF61173.1 hypothetical protein H104_06034 [Trichophyton rubrum CBS 289.86]EZF71804.1 hypothetical protein H105_06059 [Trichophyton soudanense CBS 452.61]EZF82386.1 hypothetical protein H110_06042 [Trichophyton rubrum MR1448]EZF93067.1 hypothetical protein H113_06088 [Trichophyton rub
MRNGRPLVQTSRHFTPTSLANTLPSPSSLTPTTTESAIPPPPSTPELFPYLYKSSSRPAAKEAGPSWLAIPASNKKPKLNLYQRLAGVTGLTAMNSSVIRSRVKRREVSERKQVGDAEILVNPERAGL